MKNKKVKKFLIFLSTVLLLWLAGHFFSTTLSEKGKVSREDFVYCNIQVTEVINETGYVWGTRITDTETAEELFDFFGELEVRKALPWERLHPDEESPYMIYLQYDSEEMGRCEFISCWTNGQIDFREESYMVTGEPKTKMTDMLELLIQTYETEEEKALREGLFLLAERT